MGSYHPRLTALRHDRLIAGVRYISIRRTSHELGWSRDAILNWLTAKEKFTAGPILEVVIINGHYWFTWASVQAAKKALRHHGRLSRR